MKYNQYNFEEERNPIPAAGAGITAITRLIIIDHESPMDTLLYSGAILVLVITLFIANSNQMKRQS